MYAKFFGLTREPFSIAPDPRALFMSERHRDALAHLVYGLGGGGGFVLLTGEIGAGKTTLCRCFLEQVPPNCNVAYIFNPKLTVTELLESVCDEFHVAIEPREPSLATVKDYVDPLNRFLLEAHAAGRNSVLIIDEAQSLSAGVLEQLRLLTNLETNERKLLQIVLIGQPELREMLARPELEQLAQRVIARFHLGALTSDETSRYVRHRLAVAGLDADSPFERDALSRVHRLSRGIPRRINMLCDRALLGAYAGGRRKVTPAMLEHAAAEVFDDGARAGKPARRRNVAVAAVLVGAAAFGAATLALDSHWPRLARLSDPVVAKVSAGSAETAPPGEEAAVRSPELLRAAEPVRDAPALEFLAARELKERFPALHRSEADAWRELAPAWQLDLGDAEPCAAAARVQVQCYRNIGSTLTLIRQLGRPGIVTLYDEENRPFYALLVALGKNEATLRIGGAAQTVALISLAGVWRGEFATLWRAPPGYSARSVDGPSRATALWLDAQFAQLEAALPPPARAASGAALRSRVLAFQLAQGLLADGLAGPTTLMQLNRAVGIDEPRLGMPG